MGKLKLKKLDKKTEEIFKASSVAVLLENLTDNVGILAEGQNMLSEKLDREVGDLRSEIGGLNLKIDGLETKFDGLEKEMKEGFSMVMDYLKRIDEEIMEIKAELKNLKKEKVDWKIYLPLEERVKNNEMEIKQLKLILRDKMKSVK